MDQEEKERIVSYIHEFAFEWGRLWNTTLTDEKKMELIKERMRTPEEFVETLTQKKLLNQK